MTTNERLLTRVADTLASRAEWLGVYDDDGLYWDVDFNRDAHDLLPNEAILQRFAQGVLEESYTIRIRVEVVR